MTTSGHASEVETPHKCIKHFPEQIVCAAEAMSNACKTDMEEFT